MKVVNDFGLLDEPFLPLLSKDANNYYESLLTTESIVCEYGSGRSTIWLAQRVGKVISIEHDEDWYNAVFKTLKSLGLGADLNLITDAEEYTTFLQNFPDGHFDVICLDGWRPSRSRAASYARHKVKPLGYLVIDNFEWKPVVDGARVAGIDAWEIKRFTGETVGYMPGVTIGPLHCQARFYQRPKEVKGDSCGGTHGGTHSGT